jgi:hypothetical protein
MLRERHPLGPACRAASDLSDVATPADFPDEVSSNLQSRTARIEFEAQKRISKSSVCQGQGWQRNIVMNGSPHLPTGIRQWFGDSRGRRKAIRSSSM